MDLNRRGVKDDNLSGRRLAMKDILLSMDWDYISMYPGIHGEWKKAYEEAMEGEVWIN